MYSRSSHGPLKNYSTWVSEGKGQGQFAQASQHPLLVTLGDRNVIGRMPRDHGAGLKR